MYIGAAMTCERYRSHAGCRSLSRAAAIALTASCAALALLGCTPKTLVRTVPVPVAKYIRAPLPESLIQPCRVIEPDPACWGNQTRQFCNGQMATMLYDYRAALEACDADKTALRSIK